VALVCILFGLFAVGSIGVATGVFLHQQDSTGTPVASAPASPRPQPQTVAANAPLFQPPAVANAQGVPPAGANVQGVPPAGVTNPPPYGRSGWAPNPSGGPPASAPTAQRRPSFDEWLQDFEAAKRQAAKENKDVLVLFDGSDWCGFSIRMAEDAFFQRSFREQAGQKFVLVFIDFPKGASARARVADPGRNARLQEQFKVEGYPTMMLSDARGEPYSMLVGYQEGGADKVFSLLLGEQGRRVQRDQLFTAIETARGAEKLPAAKKALDYLKQSHLLPFYRRRLDEWCSLAEQYDPRNARGEAEVFFEANWLVGLLSVDASRALELIPALEEWKKTHAFRDPDRAARLYLAAAGILAEAEQREAAMKFVQAAIDANPSDRHLKELLQILKASLGTLSSGTGFAVAPGGYILTNAHVVEGEGKLRVKLSPDQEPLPAEVVALDKHGDMALLHVKLPAGATLVPLRVDAERTLSRLEEVATFGFPLGELIGSGIKSVTGKVVSPPQSSNNMVLLDCRINPGNSGGPLCDKCGNVVGMVSAKFTGRDLDSYGLALPATDLREFLAKNLKSYKPETPSTKKLDWEDVDRKVSPSVVQVFKAP
jgi:S1-C subfamily serine protease